MSEDTAYIKVAVPRDKKEKAEEYTKEVHGVGVNQYLRSQVFELAEKMEKRQWANKMV
jgi:hypothetical protein